MDFFNPHWQSWYYRLLMTCSNCVGFSSFFFSVLAFFKQEGGLCTAAGSGRALEPVYPHRNADCLRSPCRPPRLLSCHSKRLIVGDTKKWERLQTVCRKKRALPLQTILKTQSGAIIIRIKIWRRIRGLTEKYELLLYHEQILSCYHLSDKIKNDIKKISYCRLTVAIIDAILQNKYTQLDSVKCDWCGRLTLTIACTVPFTGIYLDKCLLDVSSVRNLPFNFSDFAFIANG